MRSLINDVIKISKNGKSIKIFPEKVNEQVTDNRRLGAESGVGKNHVSTSGSTHAWEYFLNILKL